MLCDLIYKWNSKNQILTGREYNCFYQETGDRGKENMLVKGYQILSSQDK